MEVEPGKYLVRILGRGGASYYLGSKRLYLFIRASEFIFLGLFGLLFLCKKFAGPIFALLFFIGILQAYILPKPLSRDESKKYEDRFSSWSLAGIFIFVIAAASLTPKKYWPTFILNNNAFMHWNCETCNYNDDICDVKPNSAR